MINSRVEAIGNNRLLRTHFSLTGALLLPMVILNKKAV